MLKRQKTAFIIVCWNNSDLLKGCLDSIQAQSVKGSRVILVDNDSHDDSVEVARKCMPNIEIIESGANHGFAKGNNIGIELALRDEEVGYIALLNTDARIDPMWLERITEFAKHKPKAACLQGTTFDYYNHDVIDSTHIYISRNGQGTQGSWRDIYQAEYGPKKVFGVNAAACVITREFIEEQPFKGELFDETMFMYLEDVDLAARATVMGWDNYIVPMAKAYHMGSVSSNKKDPSFSLYMTFRNNTGLLIKNLPLKVLWKVMRKLIKADIASIKHLRRTGRSKASPAVIKGRLMSLLFIPVFIVKRFKLKPKRIVDQDYLWKIMLIGH